jgi:hypothetical protein
MGRVLTAGQLYKAFGAALFLAAIVAATNVNADSMPALRMEFHVEESTLSELLDVLTRYAEQEGFTVENIGPNMPHKDRSPVFYGILLRQDSNKVMLINIGKQDRMLLLFYMPKQDADSQRLADRLIFQLREKWPDIHVYTGS